MFENISILLILYGSALASLMALSQLFMLRRHFRHFYLFLIFVSLFYLGVILTLTFTGYIRNYPKLVFTEIPFYFCLIASLYVYFDYLFNDNFRVKKANIHFLPTIISVLIMPYIISLPTDQKLPVIEEMFLYGKHNYLSFLYATVCVVLFVYVYAFLKKNLIIKNFEQHLEHSFYVLLTFVLLVTYGLCLVFYFLSPITESL